MSEKPPWRVAIEQFERSIGAPMEEYIKTEEFADFAANAAKSQAKMQREVEASTSQWLKTMGLPTAGDIEALREEIAELRKEVRALSQAVKPAPKPRSAKLKPKPVKTPAKRKPAAKA